MASVNPGLFKPLAEGYVDYLHDESRLEGNADCIAFPESEDEVRSVVSEMGKAGRSITVQGARTGIAGGAVPSGGCILNLSRMKTIGRMAPGDRSMVVQPGALLSEVRAVAAANGCFFPPDPTETSASVGGMIAANASGALSFHYGPTRKWVSALRVVLADGSWVRLQRGERFASGRSFSLPAEDGGGIHGVLPAYTMPAVKSAAGYFVADDMDLIDLFIGMEGTLGIITGAELELIPRPASVCGVTVFLPSEEAALSFVRLARGDQSGGRKGLSVRPVAIEYFNADTLALLRRVREAGTGGQGFPLLSPSSNTAVYLEFHGSDEALVEGAALAALEAASFCGGLEQEAWYASRPREMDQQKAFRHAVPEAVNALISERRKADPAITKLGTDMSVPDRHLETVMALYRDDLASTGLESVIFGHIGNNHVHVNILPRTQADYALGRNLYQAWARRVVDLGGSVSAEHGIGRLKTPLLARMFGADGMAQMRVLKQTFDPAGILNPGVLFG